MKACIHEYCPLTAWPGSDECHVHLKESQEVRQPRSGDECPTCGVLFCVQHADSIFFGRDISRAEGIARARREAKEKAG